jgi:hypothetical protein
MPRETDNRSILQMPRAEAEKRLQERIVEGKKLLELNVRNQNEFDDLRARKQKWSDYNGELLKRMVDTNELLNDYFPSPRPGSVGWGTPSLEEQISNLRGSLRRSITRLESILERLELIPELKVPTREEQEDERPQQAVGLIFRIKLHQMLTSKFNEGEIKNLCFYLGVDYDSLSDQGKDSKARELISYLEHRERLEDLIETGKHLRPEINWDEFQLPENDRR